MQKYSCNMSSFWCDYVICVQSFIRWPPDSLTFSQTWQFLQSCNDLMCQPYLTYVSVISQKYVRHISGISHAQFRYISGCRYLMLYLKVISGVNQAKLIYFSIKSQACLVSISSIYQNISGSSWEYLRHSSGIYLAYLKHIIGIFQEYIRHT